MAVRKPQAAPDLKTLLEASSRQLNSAMTAQEQAAVRILGLVELLMERYGDHRDTMLKLQGIMEACSFHDVAGQRMRRVDKLLRSLAASPDARAELRGPSMTPAAEEMQEAAKKGGLSQEQIDALLSGADASKIMKT